MSPLFSGSLLLLEPQYHISQTFDAIPCVPEALSFMVFFPSFLSASLKWIISVDFCSISLSFLCSSVLLLSLL